MRKLAFTTGFKRDYKLCQKQGKEVLSATTKKHPLGCFLVVARSGRFERPTHSLEGCCSIQLS